MRTLWLALSIVCCVFLLYSQNLSLPEHQSTLQARGVQRALDDWRGERAMIYDSKPLHGVPADGLTAYYYFDYETGLRWSPKVYTLSKGQSIELEAYSATIRSLLAQLGVPQWSMKRFGVSG